MGYDDNSPIILYSEGWKRLPDGSQQLLLQCNTILDYAMMPKQLLFGELTLDKSGWDSARRVAIFR